MGFIQAGFLAALGAVAVPIIIHLVFGQRARRVDLGTLRFLKIALSQNARRKRLKRWLLLALRIGAVSLLAVLFAMLAWRTSLGGLNSYNTHSETQILGFPEWVTYAAMVPPFVLTSVIGLYQGISGFGSDAKARV